MTTFATVAQPPIVGGIDAHKDKHHVVALDLQGVLLDNREFLATTCGYGDFGSFGTAISFVLVRRKRRFGTAPT
jgi:hypothetical protein